MRMAMRGWAWTAAAALAACGGGGAGGGGGHVFTNADLVDTYFFVRESIQATAPVSVGTSTGTLSADGVGIVALTATSNVMGTITTPPTLPLDYEVAPDGGLQLLSAGSVISQGGIDGTGRVAVLGLVAPGSTPGIQLLVRRSGFHDVGDLSGTYHLALLLGLPSTGDSISAAGPATFDGAGTASYSGITSNHMGTIGTTSATFTYTAAGDGTSVGTIGGASYEGGIGPGGDVAMWGGATDPAGDLAVVVVVRAATSASVATLAGSYWMVGLGRSAIVTSSSSFTGTLASDGAGGATLSVTSNVAGTVSTPAPATLTYTVAADGTLTLDAGPFTMRGGITQDGRFAVLAGGLEALSSPTIFVLCRK